MSKKGEMEMWMLVLGGLMAIIIVVILIVIFSGGTEKGQKGLLSCLGKGGSCVTLDKCSEDGGTISETFECPKKTDVCCFKEAVV